ncbi:hypothetical protein L1987_16383 [Smallanthus sonchifolius]|uniref:Uncharacterized protein n=1 Tax=Smallanthus sonchifolius TaxID=185202 RepID=A0ACB9JAV0_9ASTR|nr:hypothetical protein L1987_16383 [Smallanthus sonchifolius]
MATHKLITFKSYFNFVYESVPADLVQRMVMKVWSYIWVFVLSSFRHLIEHLVGSRKDDDHVEILGTSVGFDEQEEGIARSSSGSNCSMFDGIGGEEKSEFTFGFQFQMKEEDLIGYGGVPEVKLEKIGDVFMENKYQFVSVQDFGGFVAEPESASFTVHELFVESPSIEDDFIIKSKDEKKELNENSNLSSGKVDEFMGSEVSLGQVLQKVDLSTVGSIICEEKFKESVADDSGCDEVEDIEEKSELNLGKDEEVLKTEQVDWLGDFFMKNDSFCYGFDSSQEIESDSLDDQEVDSVIERGSECFSPSVAEEIDDDCIELEPNLEKEQHISESNVERKSDSCLENTMDSETELMEGTEFEEESEVKSWESDSDDEEEDADILLEHQELIGQMKMELKNIRTGGLPTILEEVETPRMKEDYKPLISLKINEKLEHRDQMAEIQKFYKSYTEKMRKLDVLNYQTLQAINFLRMKHPDQLNTGENASLSAIKSVLFPSLWPCKLRRIYADPTLKSITELHKDLEIVYVGQACLSWEILHWQYKKAKELQLYDPQGYRSYNQIAIEFQQFHVLLKRFTEDELFQGPRVQNYTKQRCNLRGLLQVPAIKDDNLKDKKARKKEEGDAVSISSMTKIIKESMAVFWEFLHTDKDTTNLFLTIILQGSKAHLQDPADYDLFFQIKAIHQKKERSLKDMLRTGNCIMKKFQKQQETILDQHMFVSQVELRLISRVLNLPRLTRDQLLWCHSKLNNIIFIDRKIHVEDSLFLIFPC